MEQNEATERDNTMCVDVKTNIEMSGLKEMAHWLEICADHAKRLRIETNGATFPPETKSDELENLIELAADCNIDKSPELFDRLLKVVYGDKDMIAGYVDKVGDLFIGFLNAIKDKEAQNADE